MGPFDDSIVDDDPDFRDQSMPKPLPEGRWERMKAKERYEYIKWCREYRDRLEQERRDKKKGKYGY